MTDDVHAALYTVVHAAGSIVDSFLGSAGAIDDSVDDTGSTGIVESVELAIGVGEENVVEAERTVTTNIDISHGTVAATDNGIFHREDKHTAFVCVMLESHHVVSLGALGSEYLHEFETDGELDVELTTDEAYRVVENHSIAVGTFYITEVS